MKVLWPVEISSLAPTRVKIRSTGAKAALLAGMKEPVWAMMVSTATWRI